MTLTRAIKSWTKNIHSNRHEEENPRHKGYGVPTSLEDELCTKKPKPTENINRIPTFW
jgi:hypothetical protein